jgi:hypothetical protein
MENRYLPILHESISLGELRVSNEPLASWGEWVVNIIYMSAGKGKADAGLFARR